MSYDPQGHGAAAGDPLVRRGVDWESAKRLGALASRAERNGTAINGVYYGHGVSVTSPEANERLARDPADAVQSPRGKLEEAGFEVLYTPTAHDHDHHTVQLPKPVTADVARCFNTVFKRIRRRRR